MLNSVNFPDKRRIDRHSSLEDSKSVAFPQSLLAEPRKEFPNSPLDIGTSLSRKKKKIFGVEISEGNTDAFDSTSNMSSNLDPHERNHRVDLSSSYVQSLSLHEGNERSKTDWGMNGEWLDFTKVDKANMAAAEVLKKDREHSQKSRERILRGNQENSKGTLPWFLRDSQGSSDLNKTKCSYFMNLDSLQSCSHKFFKKVELQNSNQKKEVKGEISEVNSSGLGDDFARKVEFDENAPKNHLEIEEVVSSKGLNNFISNLRHCIDLNLSLDEEEAPPPPSLPSAIVKIATAEIDLEAPAVIECELDASPKGLGSKESSSLEEQDKFAAEVMIGISSHAEKKRDDDDDDDDNSFTRLKWFAQVISSEKFDESIPSDMDDFEFMTLKLKETKEEHPPYEPSLKDPSDDEALTRRTRRGQLRRGRQRRDFQQDILSGLVTLSRLQVTEDFQAFEELLKAKDRTRESGLGPRGPTRNGRGRKHLGAPITVKAPCSSHAEIEERSLAGWGKKTRRLPRQRCPNALLSFPVKC